MANNAENRPIADLLGSLVSDISTLFRKEVQLAKTEASEKVSEAAGAATSIAIGGVLLIGALGVFLAALVSLLAALFVSMGMDPTPENAFAAVLVALVFGLAGWMTINRGLNALKASNLNMNRTANSLGRDADIVKERL